VDVFDGMNCEAANTFCATELMVPFFNTGAYSFNSNGIVSDCFVAAAVVGKNPYDISRDCEGDIDDTLCYPVTK
jgi:cathepsin A (carboxypeptidase C)